MRVRSVLKRSWLVGIAPGGVASGALDFAEVAELPRRGHQHVIHEDGGIAFDAVLVGQLGRAEIFADERDSARDTCAATSWTSKLAGSEMFQV